MSIRSLTRHSQSRQQRAQSVVLCCSLISSLFCLAASAPPASAQKNGSGPVVVQPGAPGKPSKRLPSTTTGKLPPSSPADVDFMQGMIMHHQQAVEMTALIPSHTQNKELRTLGARISHSQSDEIGFMKRWLAARGEPVMPEMPGMHEPGMAHQGMSHEGMSHDGMSQHKMPLMPGMLTPEQMEALRNAKGDEFDRLFLSGMIQHHNGALTMVKELFDAPGAGQDGELFDFATDVDSGQRAEIRIMQSMLDKEFSEEKR